MNNVDTFAGLARDREAQDAADPSDIRALGWSVAVHNDYRILGGTATFWLFTRPTNKHGFAAYGEFVKGEGPTDADALNQVREMLARYKGS